MPARVILESPYTAPTTQGLIRNRNYLKLCILDSIARGEAPWAGHAFYTQFLNDRSVRDRILGMRLAQSWLFPASLVAVYTNLGVSRGMQAGIALAHRVGIPVEYRQLSEGELESISDRSTGRSRRGRKSPRLQRT